VRRHLSLNVKSFDIEFILSAPPRVVESETREEVLVTAIETLSPINKRSGQKAYEEYQRKRRRLLADSVHLIEINLLRGSIRPALEEPVDEVAICSRGSCRRPRAVSAPRGSSEG
jgi:Protein of unknown function (DUF4058)